MIKSLKSEETSYVEFENRSPRDVTLYWHDYSGKLVRYAKIKQGALYRIDTFVTHPWSAADCTSGDRHLIDNHFVFYPRPQVQDGEVPQFEKVFIDLPVYPLWIRCLQVVRKKIRVNDVDNLQIPDNLRHALKCVPNLKCSTYSDFMVVNKLA